MTQPDDALILHCAKCGRDRPRGWFVRSGEGRRSSWCRDCRAPGKVADAARRRGAIGEGRTGAEDRVALWTLQGGICPICHKGMVHPAVAMGSLHVDHAVPVARGGGHVGGNLRLTHGRCNLRKGAKLAGARVWVVVWALFAVLVSDELERSVTGRLVHVCRYAVGPRRDVVEFVQVQACERTRTVL